MQRRIILAAFLMSLALNAVAMVAGFSLASILGLVVGWYLADLASGVVHMLFDYRPCPPGKRLNELFFYTGSRESEDYLALVRDRMASFDDYNGALGLEQWLALEERYLGAAPKAL